MSKASNVDGKVIAAREEEILREGAAIECLMEGKMTTNNGNLPS